MDWKGLAFLLLTTMSAHSSVLSCPEECECYHDINLYTANCSSFPTSNENELAKIEVFNLSPMLLVPLTLKEGQFVGFRKLKYLSLSNCSIYYIHKKAFYGLKHLIEIDLSFNDIQTLDPLVFQHNNDLTSLILRGNPIKLTANTPFLVSNTIQRLDLGLCSIKNIPRGVFFGVKKIMYMSLDGNRLQTLKYNSLPRGLKYLNIANNMIINVPTELLTSLINLHRLDLSGNPINCTCPLMDLQDWFSGRGVTFDNEVICASPPKYAGRSWNEVNENELCIAETLSDEMQKKPLKKIAKNGLKSKEKYFFSSDKNKYLETSSLQADEPVRFVDERMDPNAEILFQNDDTNAMGVMMQEMESAKTEKPDDKLENNSDGDGATENDTNGSDVTIVEDENKKTAFDDLDSDDPDLKEEETENKEVESNKQHDTDNGDITASEDQLDMLTDSETKTDLQNDDVSNADNVKSEGEEIVETPSTDDTKKETEEKIEPDSVSSVVQGTEENKKESIPVEEHEGEYDKKASEALLTNDLIHQKGEKQNSVETNPIESALDERKEKEPINTGTEDIISEKNSSQNKDEINKDQVQSTGEISNKPQNEIKEELAKTETEEMSNKPQNEIKEEISLPEKVENIKGEIVPTNSESEKKHLSHSSALDKDLLVQEDLIETAGVGNKGDTSDVDSTEEPIKTVDENNIDTGVIIDNGEKLEETLGQIKAAQSPDEHDKIENSDLKPEIESDLTSNENLSVGSAMNINVGTKDSVPVANATDDNSEDKLNESPSNTESTAVVENSLDNASKERLNESITNSSNFVDNAVIENNNVAEEEGDGKSTDKENVESKNGPESIAVSRETEESTTPHSSEANVDINVLTVVETESESTNESEVIKTDDHIQSTADKKLGNLVAINKTSEEEPNEKEGIEAAAEPIDSKESFKSKLNEEMFITDVSGEVNNTESDDYDISTTQTPDVLTPIEESRENETIYNTDIEAGNNITDTDSSEKNDTNIIGIPAIPESTKVAETDEPPVSTTVSEQILTKQNVSVDGTELHEHEHDHEGLVVTTDESVTDIPETTAIGDVTAEVTPGETSSGNDTNVSLVGTDKKPNADIKEDLKPISDDEVLQEPEPFEFQEAHIVLACILLLVLALVLFSVYKCASKKNKSTKRITKDIESNHGTEMQDMASLLPKPSEDDKSTKKYPEDASSNEKVKLITEEKEEDDNQYQRGNETQAVVEKENTLNNNAPNAPNKPTPVNRTAAPATINPVAPIQRTKVKVAIIPESIPRTPIFVQKTYNNGVSTNG